MPSQNYAAISFTAGEQPTAGQWNQLGTNDASFNTGLGFNDGIITWRHLESDIVPTGLILPYGGSATPSTNWLFCDGTAYLRSAYSTLFSVIGTSFGVGDGSTTFNVPNMGGNVPGGFLTGDPNFGNIGQSGGEDAHTLSYNEMPVHSHGVADPGHSHGHSWSTFVQPSGTTGGGNQRLEINGNGQQLAFGDLNINGAGTGIGIYNAGSGYSHNNLQPYVTTSFLIKT
jgi:microcystin-dependent protein